jgi:sugar lactone lactonase YvrE
LVDRENHRVRKINTSGTITTFAGTGKPGYNGDGRQAATAQLSYPTSVTSDAVGNVYITDHSNARIRKVGLDGIIKTIAGTGTPGYNGDGAALSTKIFGPDGITVDKSGNVLFADQYNMRVRKITTTGQLVTIAGNGTAGFGGDGGSALRASLNWPKDVKIDKAGNLLIADRKNRRIRRISSTGIITTIAGNGGEGYSGDGGKAVYARLDPGAIATDALGNIFIADTENECIRKIDATGIITKFAGRGRTYGDGGLATSAQVHTPTAVATNAKGSVFIAEYDNHRIRVVSPATTTSARSSNNNDINAEIFSSPVTFSIYPNPAQATLNIQTSNAQGLSKVEVIDAAGRVHISQTVGLASPVIQLQIQRLTPGLYFVRTTDKQNNTNTKEFLKQ